MKVNICGIPHEVIECKDEFTISGVNFGEIKYKECEIRLNEDMPDTLKKEALCHEMIHGILFHIGESQLSDDEKFVQALGNAICQGFEVKELV